MKKQTIISVVMILVVVGMVSFVSAEPIIDSLVTDRLKNQTEVYVMVLLEDDSNITYEGLGGTIAERRETYERRREYFKQAEERVISTLSESEFKLDYKASSINAFGGYITKEGLEKLKNNPKVLVIEANRKIKVALYRTKSLVNATKVWAEGYSGKGQTVCILDTGVNASHSDLQGKVLAEKCFCRYSDALLNSSDCCPNGNDTDNDAEDYSGHGTRVTGIIVSQDSPYMGVAPNASVVVAVSPMSFRNS